MRSLKVLNESFQMTQELLNYIDDALSYVVIKIALLQKRNSQCSIVALRCENLTILKNKIKFNRFIQILFEKYI